MECVPSAIQLDMRARLTHVRIEHLADRNRRQPVCYNTVSNVKLDPSPGPISLMHLAMALQPCVEIKRGFGALIYRQTHTLDKFQMGIKNLKPTGSTGLIFPSGAFGLTGTCSPAEARNATHECRLRLYNVLGVRTGFRRFIITNQVRSTSLGFSVDLARLHAEDPDNRVYEPEVFPGLFFTVTRVHEDRMVLHQKVAGSLETVRRQLRLVEEDYSNVQRQNLLAAATAEAHANRKAATRPLTPIEEKALEMERVLRSLQSCMENFMQAKAVSVMLVFRRGNVVGLGPSGYSQDNEAFAHVAEVASRFRVDLPPASGRRRGGAPKQAQASADGDASTAPPSVGSKRRPEAQQRLAEKNSVMDAVHATVAPSGKRSGGLVMPSKAVRMQMQQAADEIADPHLRSERIKEILREAKKTGKGKKERKKKQADDDDDLLEEGLKDIDEDQIDAAIEEAFADLPDGDDGEDAATKRRRVPSEDQDFRQQASPNTPKRTGIMAGILAGLD